ncbi:Tudor/PWWP/MBT superfamily protein [Thalictrum thalictroides]|uniref:Tudor/PWWP/MBT superfamily protein n=1 Tax=Thalictrum thalictroides TaxID=46969 RepID=A0A7J6VB06_THATH|nr:Tudor/PWWP/MBT superfamily protein [Thalictrum thalictroides]
MTEKDLEELVLEAGNKLLKVPADVDELLALLDRVEGLLSKVEQSPIKSMQNALSPIMNALVSSELLSHKNADVKVSVAACVSEVTRITAPEAPYNDDQMKQIFEVIVESFEMLWDKPGQSYEKRVSILETVAKVRSCVVMLDLECDGLILQMFNYFLRAIRDHHTENVFSSMETIMSLVLEESEEIPPPLLYPLLASVKKEDQDVLPIARKLGEKVLETCSAKLKPYLMDAIKSMGMSPSDYSKIVASICQETSDTAEHNDDSVSGEHLAEERSLPEMMNSDKPPQVTEELNPEAACPTEVGSEKSPKAVTSNSDAQNVNDDLSVGVDSKKKEDNSQPSSQVAEVEPVLSEPIISQPETKPDEPVKKKRGRKPNASVQTPETSGQSKVEDDTETDLPVEGKNDSKEDDTSPSEEQSVNKSAVLPGPDKEVVEQDTLPTAPRDEPVKVASPSPTKNLPDVGRAKRGRPARVKKGNLKEDTDHGSPSVLKEAISSKHVESDALISGNAVSKVGAEGENETEEKPNEQLAKKEQSDKEKSDGATSDSEEKPLKRSSKKVDTKNNKDEGSSAIKQGEKAKRGRPKSLPGKDLPGESSNKKMGSSLKPPEKSTSEKETPTTKSKRKRTPANKETFENKDHGEDLVGSRIKVWWPDDRKFYEGVVESFDPSLNKHKVSYLDGDEEILVLKDERWKLVEGNTVADKGQSTDPSSPDASSEMPQEKKAKTNSASGSKQAKTNTPLNKGKEISTSKSKVEAPKSSRSSKKDGNKAADSTSKSAGSAKNDNIGKSKGNTPKSGTKVKDDSPKTGIKSKVDTPKIGAKSKDATPKTGTKSKDETPKAETKSEDDKAKTRTKSKKETPKTGSKSKANGTSAKGKRAEETDTVEGEMLGSSKTHESETKSGKKRRR